MSSVLEARNRFQLVHFTLDWIERVQWQIKDVQPPFIDLIDKTKQEYKKTATAMRLDKNPWLHTSSTISAILALKSMYSAGGAVGVVNPSYHELAGLSSRKRTAGEYGAMNPTNDRIIAAICIDHHWVAYVVDKPKHEGQAHVREHHLCIQKDNTSCGVWCLSVLDLLLGGHPWVDSLYKVQPYLRLNYLFMAISMQCEAV
ncbi:hypothetical protein F441_22551 [Phytophthora nicotianae CJ01A1]|uniref:Ubiquitin-like protease family profile domain-containing protein n=1 Tax=Phytophthora nicotianae CJ01A1 TaxID=1317063 RepID=W2VNU2_PHYNI|nr:hypothetical protein F441_22551 [Phytophthora nicotianae CJ01A1]